MKKLIGISLVSIGFLTLSCEKEQPRPTEDKTSQAPVWKKATAPSTGTGSATNGSGITDPNNDPDMNTKRINKQ